MSSFLVIGLGQFGKSVAIELMDNGHEVMAVDNDEEKIDSISNDVTHVMLLDAHEENNLKAIGVNEFDAVIVGIATNIENSILTTLLLKELGAKEIICKAKSHIHEKALKLIGANKVVRPELEMGIRVAKSLTQNNILSSIDLPNDKTIIKVQTPIKWIGKNVFKKLKKYNGELLSIFDDDIVVSISNGKNEILKENYILILLVPDYALADFELLEME